MTTEFISYEPTSGQSYEGIITFMRHGKDLLRYKWVAKKDGKGHFASPPSMKLVDEEGERYVGSHLVDSRSDDEEMQAILRKGVNAYLQVKGVRPIQMEQSTFTNQSSYQPKQNDDCPF